MSARVRLSREVRFGVLPADGAVRDASGPGTSNGFAGNPALTGLFPFVALKVTVAGRVDPHLGMLINIKTIDQVVRDAAVAVVREGAEKEPLATGSLALALLEVLGRQLAGKVEAVERVELALSPFLSVVAEQEERPMVRLCQRFEFSAAHRLHSPALSEAENWEVFGRCNNPNGHGHNYELEVVVAGPADGATGAVMGVRELQRIVNERVIDVFDHKHLNLDCAEFREPAGVNPTVENIARVLYGRLKEGIPAPAKLAAVRVWETPKTMCEYSE